MTREEQDNAIKVLRNFDLNNPKVNLLLFSAEEITNAFEMAIKALEQEPILDKIRAEIADIYCSQYCENPYTAAAVRKMALEIIDKYTTENISNCDSCKHQKEVDGSNCYECVKGMHNNYTAESDIEKRKEWPHKLCINYEDGCEEWAGCPCVYYKAESEVEDYE